MTLRELMIERIMFCVDEHTLTQEFQLTESDLPGLSDLDLLELYDVLMFETAE